METENDTNNLTFQISKGNHLLFDEKTLKTNKHSYNVSRIEKIKIRHNGSKYHFIFRDNNVRTWIHHHTAPRFGENVIKCFFHFAQLSGYAWLYTKNYKRVLAPVKIDKGILKILTYWFKVESLQVVEKSFEHIDTPFFNLIPSDSPSPLVVKVKHSRLLYFCTFDKEIIQIVKTPQPQHLPKAQIPFVRIVTCGKILEEEGSVSDLFIQSFLEQINCYLLKENQKSLQIEGLTDRKKSTSVNSHDSNYFHRQSDTRTRSQEKKEEEEEENIRFLFTNVKSRLQAKPLSEALRKDQEIRSTLSAAPTRTFLFLVKFSLDNDDIDANMIEPKYGEKIISLKRPISIESTKSPQENNAVAKRLAACLSATNKQKN